MNQAYTSKLTQGIPVPNGATKLYTNIYFPQKMGSILFQPKFI